MSLRGGTWTVMFTDLVGSTAQRARVGDIAADDLRREHDQIAARAAVAHGGQVVKGTGDGCMCVFAGAADAIDAAVFIQQEIERRNRSEPEPLELRVGVSLGDLALENDDLFGLPVNEAARLCALAEPNEILLSDVVRLVAGTRVQGELLDRGSRGLKGIPKPVRVWAVPWVPAAEPEPVPVPSALLSAGAMGFSGRASELAKVLDAWKRVLVGQRHAVLVSGEPGIGKTRLVAESAIAAHGDGALVLFGRCDDEIAVPFQPFAEALDWYCEHAPEVVVGRHAADLARLSGRIAERVSGLAQAMSSDPESEQYRLFEAVTSWLSTLSATQPVVLILDDLHWATKPTMLMLRHVLASTAAERLLVLATFRDTESDGSSPLTRVLADLRRFDGIERIRLAGLDEAGVVSLLERVGEQPVNTRPVALAQALVARTEGNPFFVGEVLRDLVEAGAPASSDGAWTASAVELRIPTGVREVLDQRLARLGDQVTQVLRGAAVVGREFAVDVLTAATGIDENSVLDALDAAVAARLVHDVDSDRFRFAHALVQGALVDAVPGSRRIRLHRLIAEYLERAHRSELAAIAHHWLQAANAADPPRLVEAVLAAAHQADQRGASDDAADLLARLLVIGVDGADGETRREVVLRHAMALQRSGREDAWRALGDAAALAQTEGDVDRLVRAVIARSRGAANSAAMDDEQASLHRAALAGLGPEPSAGRVVILGQLGLELTVFEPEEARVYLDEAVALASELGDRLVLVWAFQLGHPAHWTDRGWEDRALAALADLDDVDRARMSRDDRGNAAWLRHDIAWNRGDIADARAQRMLMDDLVDNGPSAALRYINLVNRSCGAFLEGRLAEAAEWNQRQLDYGNETGRPDALNYFIMLDGSVSRDQGRPEAMIETVLSALPTLPASVASFAGAHLVTWLTDAGRAEQAREIVAHERASGFLPARLPTSLKTTYAYGLSEAVMYLRDREAAAELFEIMLPWSGRMFFDSIQAYGAVDRSLGRLATLLGRFDEAESSLAAAAAFHERIGAPLFLARTWADQAELLLARDATAGLAPASSLVERAVAVARDLGAPGVERYTSSVIARRDA